MSQWIRLRDNWSVKPTALGYSFERYEHSIQCEDSDESENLFEVFKGTKPIPPNLTDDYENLFSMLISEGVISISEQPASEISEPSEEEKLLVDIRRKIVGKNCPITTVYRLDPTKSTFLPYDSSLFASIHIMSTDKEEQILSWSSGIHKNPVWAEIKAIMEGFERYASGVIQKKNLIKGSVNYLGEKAIDPRRAVRYLDEQYRGKFPLSPYSSGKDYYWSPIESLTGQGIHYLPVELIYYPIPDSIAPYPYAFANSSGVASGVEYANTVTRGVLECIERDAFMIVWLNRLVMPRIDVSSLSAEQISRIKWIKEFGYEVHLINLTLDLLPVVLALAINRNRKPAMTLGMACDPNIYIAAEKAITEVEQQLYWNFREGEETTCLSMPQDVTSVEDHTSLYASSKHLEKAEFLWKGNLSPLTEIQDSIYNLDNIVLKLKSAGIDLFVADLTPEGMENANLFVARAIPLGLVPISFGYGMEALAMPRLYTVPPKLRLNAKPWPGNIPFVHPFA